MKKLILAAGILYSSIFTVIAAEQAPPRPIGECLAEAPFGVPVTAPNTVTNCRT
jgi:hypothetical protein